MQGVSPGKKIPAQAVREKKNSYKLKIPHPPITFLMVRPLKPSKPLLAIESPVAQWLEHPTRSRRVVGSNLIWGSDFFRVPSGFYQHLISHVYISFSHSLKPAKDRLFLSKKSTDDCYLIPVNNKNSSFIPEQRKKRPNHFLKYAPT